MTEPSFPKTQQEWLGWYLHWANLALTLAAPKDAPEASDALRSKMVKGIEIYQSYMRDTYRAAHTVVWQSGNTQLLHFGNGDRAPVLIIPSLINRYGIVDLQADLSLVRTCLQAGHSVYVVDWGSPDESEHAFDFNDYIAKRLTAIIRYLTEQQTQKIICMGYCLGGTLLAGLLARWPALAKQVGQAVFFGTPWDFHAGGTAMDWRLVGYHETCKVAINAQGFLPAAMVQMGFALIDPALWAQKFITLTEKADKNIADFVAVEDWLNAPVNLTAPSALQLIDRFYRDNEPNTKQWQLGFEYIDMTQCHVKCLVVNAEHDRIVPYASSHALAKLLPKVTEINVDTGHIGMMASRRAAPKLWAQVLDFIK